MKNTSISIEQIHKAVAQSSKMEGLSFNAAKKNKKVIQILKSYGRGFAIQVTRDENGVFIGSIPAIPACHTQGKTKKETFKKLNEVLKLCLRNNGR